MGWFSDVISNPIGTLGDTGQKIIDNPIPAITAAATGNPAALLAYAAPTGTASQGSTVSGLLSGLGNLLQGNSNTAASQTAAQAAQFRPVGITNNFGTSNFAFDPTTGQMTSAGYQLSPELQSYQNSIMGNTRQGLNDVTNIQNLGRQYIAQSPQAAAQDWMSKQQALLQPGNDRALAGVQNQLAQTGRTGLSVAQGGALGAANPEMQAYYNALAQQNTGLASQAMQQGQNQVTFGQGLLQNAYSPFAQGLTTMGAIEGLGQQPLELSASLAGRSATAGTNAGKYLQQAGQYNPTAQVLNGLGSNQGISAAIGGLFGNSTAPAWTTGSDVMPASTFSGSGDASWMSSPWM